MKEEQQVKVGVPAASQPSGQRPSGVEPVPVSSKAATPNADFASDEAFERLMGSISRVYGLRPGHVLTQEDFDAIQHFDRHFREESDNAVEAFSQGYGQGLRDGGSADIEKMSERLDEKTCALGVEKALRGFTENRLSEMRDHAAALALALKNVLDLPKAPNTGFMGGTHLSAARQALKRHEELFPASGTEAATAGETEGLDPKGDGPAPEGGDAQTTPEQPL